MNWTCWLHLWSSIHGCKRAIEGGSYDGPGASNGTLRTRFELLQFMLILTLDHPERLTNRLDCSPELRAQTKEQTPQSPALRSVPDVPGCLDKSKCELWVLCRDARFAGYVGLGNGAGAQVVLASICHQHDQGESRCGPFQFSPVEVRSFFGNAGAVVMEHRVKPSASSAKCRNFFVVFSAPVESVTLRRFPTTGSSSPTDGCQSLLNQRPELGERCHSQLQIAHKCEGTLPPNRALRSANHLRMVGSRWGAPLTTFHCFCAQ